MHQYLKAIGFGNITERKELNKVLRQVENTFTQQELASWEDGYDYCQYQKEFGAGIGIELFGYMDIDEQFERQYYYPYLQGTGITSYADVFIERRIDRESYVGICEDDKVGISLIFYVQNIMEYLKERQLSGDNIRYNSVTLSGLCQEGTILLPVQKNKEQTKQQLETGQNRMRLLTAAKNGDPQAIENLTLDDIDTYTQVSRRLITEDVFSIVDTYMMPYGIECDRYSLMGEILNLEEIDNEYTGEKVYVMHLDVNGLQFDVCVPKNGVTGEPAIGRRFKGDMWLQGRINF